MSSVNNSQNASDVLSRYSVQQQQGSSSQSSGANGSSGTGTAAMGQSEFMKLMIAQIKNQSPLNPTDSSKFLSQLAQFSSLEQMQNLNTTFSNFATQYRSTQALQASAMVGRSVVVPSSQATLGSSGNVSGYVNLSQSTGNLMLSIEDASGQVVRQLDLGQQGAGQVPFQWDGKDNSGNTLPPGTYKVQAQAATGNGTQDQQTLLSANVNSVSLGQNGSITLNLDGAGSVPLSQVQQIN